MVKLATIKVRKETHKKLMSFILKVQAHQDRRYTIDQAINLLSEIGLGLAQNITGSLKPGMKLDLSSEPMMLEGL